MAQELKVGLIGCGEIAVQNAKAVVQSPHGRVVACFDINKNLAEDLAKQAQESNKPPVTIYDNFERFLADPNIEAVIVNTPHFLHKPQTIAALKAGKHVLVEKPIACTVAEGREMIAAAKAANRKLGVNFCMRYGHSIQKARTLVSEGVIGKILSWYMVGFANKPLSYFSGGFSGRSKSDWRQKRSTSGGGYLIMNQVHFIDFFRYITGQEVAKTKAVVATLNSPPGVEVEDFAYVTLQLNDGGVGCIAGGSLVPGRGPSQNLFIGAHGQIELFLNGLRVFVNEDTAGFKGGQWTDIKYEGDEWFEPRRLGVDAFCHWIQGGPAYLSPAEDGIKALEVCEAAYTDAGIAIPSTPIPGAPIPASIS